MQPSDYDGAPENFTQVLRELRELREAAIRFSGIQLDLDTSAAQHGQGLSRHRTALTTLPEPSKPSARPVDGPVSSPYGTRDCPVRKKEAFHHGVDIAAPHGTPVRAAGSGVVLYCGWRWGYGKTVSIAHDAETVSLYAHLGRIWVRPGQVVPLGEEIGAVGSTGRSTGPHLHYEVRVNNRSTDPVKFLPPGFKIAREEAHSSTAEN